MKIRRLHNFDVDYNDAVRIQDDLKEMIRLDSGIGDWKFAAGADVSYSKTTNRIFGAVVVLQYPEGKVIESAVANRDAAFPYIPGLLSFREVPALLDAFERIRYEPDVIILDGQGIAHPRGLGLASHIGLFLDAPTIGCAKSRLVGEYDEPGLEKGDCSELFYEGKIIGNVVRTRKNVKPVFVSPGHKIDLETAVRIVLDTTTRYRLPEPTRLAHALANKARSDHCTSRFR